MTPFEEALSEAHDIAGVKRAMTLLGEPRRVDFPALMREQGESERVAKLVGSTPYDLVERLGQLDRGAAATAERLNLNLTPAFIAALVAVLPVKAQP